VNEPTSNDQHAPRRPWLRQVDFAAPSVLAPDQQDRLRRMADDFGPVVTGPAMNKLGLSLEFTPLWMEEIDWREAFPMPADDSVTLELSSSAGGSMFIAIDPTLASLVVERMLGVEPDPARPLRTVTGTDRAMLSRLSEIFVAAMDRLWFEATGSNLELAEVEVHRALSQAVPASETTFTLAVEARLFSTYSLMFFMTPQSTIRPVAAMLSRPSSRATSDSPEITRAVQERLGAANVEVQVHLGQLRLTAGEIADLHPGDRVPIPTAATEAAALIVDGVRVQSGHVGRSGGRRAVRVGAVQQGGA
jgi:flagellar motor switch protein FliM